MKMKRFLQKYRWLFVLAFSVSLSSICAIHCKKSKEGPIPAIDMVLIPGGEFMMGSESGDEHEKPVHHVRVDPFYLGRTEVTVAQWHMFTDDTGYVSYAEKRFNGVVRYNDRIQTKPDANWKHTYTEQGDKYPVVLVNWKDAMAFCRWLSKRTGMDYRLPREAEWEFACRAGTTGDYYGNLDSIAWYEYNSDGHPHPVGKKLPNAFGLYDMTGNVWEWCSDSYDKNYYNVSPRTNPMGSSVGHERVSRGGSWCSKPPRARSSFRRHDLANYCFYRIGFRIARSASIR